jgi:ferredoxin
MVVTGNMKITKKQLTGLLSEWGRQFTILTPSRAGNSSSMSPWNGQNISFLDWYRNTNIPAKNCFLPDMEELFCFSSRPEGYELKKPVDDRRCRLIFAVRPCDAKALATLDNIFIETYKDSYYLNRRENSILVGLSCSRPYDSCFCTSLGSGPSDSSSFDIMSIDIGNALLLEGISDKGKKLIKESGSLISATVAEETKAKKFQMEAELKVTCQVDLEGMVEKLLAVFEDDNFWQQVAVKCISCGICTLLCPTCYCFDINDETLKGDGCRYRNLDSCSFSIYTKMAMENPRAEKWRRVRNKLCHKYEFYPLLHDTFACTGCGRCIRYCPVNWDISQVLNNVPAKEKMEKV